MILISDVHANYIAIKEVLEQLDKNEKIVHAGDVVGYNPFPNETIALFKQYNVISIAGKIIICMKKAYQNLFSNTITQIY